MNNYNGNHNSTVNQDIKSKLVGREVYTNVNQMVEYILKASHEDNTTPFCYDDIDNFYSYPEHIGTYANFTGGTEAERDEEIERLKELIEAFEDEMTDKDDPTDEQSARIDLINTEIEALEELESEAAEIYEWYAVSNWLCRKLKDQGECVIEDQSIWGRGSSGQAILLDHVIGQIAADMEILDGQSNSSGNMK